jgi:hypothetical protein
MIIIPCGGKKVESNVPVQAQHLYTGSYFKLLFNVAITLDSDVRILSAVYGLIRLNDMVVPYNKKMDKETAELIKRTLKCEESHIAHLLPKMYASAIQHLNPTRLIPEVTGMGYFIQEAKKIQRATVLCETNLQDGKPAVFLSNYRG